MTAWNHTVTLHNFQTHFNSRFRSWLVLNFLFHSGVKWTNDISNQALLFCSFSFNTGLLCSILLSVCILKSHSSLLLVDSYTGCGSWLLLVDSYIDTGCGSCNTCICHPCHNPAFHIQNRSHWIICTILSSLQHRYCFWASFCISIPYG